VSSHLLRVPTSWDWIEGQFLGAHALRHAGATWLNDGMRRIQRLTGHEDIKTLELTYADHSRGYLKEAVDFLDEAVSAGVKLNVRQAQQLNSGGDCAQ
jgi:integrase